MQTFNLQTWLDLIQGKIKAAFGDNLLFIGYHGSYARKEATKESDIDLVVILKTLTVEDLEKYREIINSMPYKEKCCGFISGEKEIQNWSKADVFQFYYEMKNLYGDITKIITPPKKKDVKIAVKTGLETLYHALCHSFLFDLNRVESLKNLYKMAFFIMQAEHFLKTDKYILTKKELMKYLTDSDCRILKTCKNWTQISDFNAKELDNLYNILFNWCKNKMQDLQTL